ncbi:hypothetical protein Dalu01_01805 [Deinococcus aluminii]|uniref:Uncharacterized protein n=1 Tax=Deinococcus aluminii TaxID=1656885 RepID=A0ABP9XDH9_9DEIO
MTTSRDINTLLYGKCTSCLSPDGVIYHDPPYASVYYCPKCAQRQALYQAGQDQLEMLVREGVQAWLSVWGAIPGMVDLGEQLRHIGDKLEEEFKVASSAQESTQSAPMPEAIS